MLPYYYEHLMTNRNSLVCLFYGLMVVEPQNMPTIGVVVMPNMLDTVVHEVYDLKGSTYGRFTKEKDMEKGAANVVQKAPTACYTTTLCSEGECWRSCELTLRSARTSTLTSSSSFPRQCTL